MKYILAIDQGTTGTTSVLINVETFEMVDKKNFEFPQIYPSPGLVEHDLNQIWQSVKDSVLSVLNKNNINPKDILSIGITNQRETTCAFDNKGMPLANAIVWQDRRTADFCNQLIKAQKFDTIKEKTGLPIDPYFSATKIHWLINNDNNVKEAKKNNNLKFGTIDTFLLYKLTDGNSYCTEGSNASRTMLMDLQNCSWDQELLDLFGVDSSNLPSIKDSFGHFGETKNLDFLPDGIPITGILGDQQSALFGQAGINSGDIKCTYGTGAFILLNTGEKIFKSDAGLVSTVAYNYNGKTKYALEASCFIAGAAVQWLRDNLNFFSESPEIEKLALSVKNLNEMEYIFFLPYFTGIGSPHWKPEAKASIMGLTRDTGKNHISLACLEGMAFSINDLIDVMKQESHIDINSLKVDGGAVKNNLLMKIQSTISDIKIVRPKIIETTAYGAALASAIGQEILSFDDIEKFWKAEKEFTPDLSKQKFYQKKTVKWKETLKRIYL